MSESVRRRRNRREKARKLALETIEERGEVSTQELNQTFGRNRIKSSVQFAGLVMIPLLNAGIVEKRITKENRAYYVMAPNK